MTQERGIELNKPVYLRYWKHAGREWLTVANTGNRITDDLAKRILENAPQITRLKSGTAFRAVPRKRVVDPLDGKKYLEVQFTPEGDWQDTGKPIIYPAGTPTSELFDILGQSTSISPTAEQLTHAPVDPPQTLQDWYELLVHNGEHKLAMCALHAQVFEFGEVDEHLMDRDTKRAMELRDKGFLRLPYQAVVYRYTGKHYGRRHVFATRDPPFAVMWGFADDTHHYVLQLSLMLSARNVKITEVEPARKLQLKRAARGKPPLPRITHVNAEHYQTAVLRSHLGGTHASPVPHLRRGHLRNLQNGHTIWIRDTLVNCRSLEEAFPRQRYEVRVDTAGGPANEKETIT